MQIEITEVGKPYKDGKYFKLDLKYVRDGKDSTRKLVAVGDTKNVFEIIKQANPGEAYEIELKKDGEYYNWVGAVPVTVEASKGATAAGGRAATKSTYETPEERAVKQLHIARQFAINASLKFSELTGEKPSQDSVQKNAQAFVDFVYRTDDNEEFPDA